MITGMQYIDRMLLATLKRRMFQGKAIIVLGARQTGKTVLVRQLLDQWPGSAVYLNADRPEIRRQLTDASVHVLKHLAGDAKVVVIDEAQRIKNIGLTLKLFIDELPEIQVVATGSSSFELSNEINEPLTGRKWEYFLFPISWEELISFSSAADAHSQRDIRLVFGMYPEIVTHPGQETELLLSLSGSYLYKDVFEFTGVRKPEILSQLLQALAYQIGAEVSYNELARMLGVDKNTISNYIDLLEKSFVVFRLMPLSRNLRNEITRNRKIYFFDNGIRNAVIEDFTPFDQRQDAGALWENFLISERWKMKKYHELFGKRYFWRTKSQQEIDYVEEVNGQFSAWEFKPQSGKKYRFPPAFMESYEPRIAEVITPDNFESFVLRQEGMT